MSIFFIVILIFFLIKRSGDLRFFFLIFRIFLIIESLEYVSAINFFNDSISCSRFSFFEFSVSRSTVLSFNDLIIFWSNWLDFNTICFWFVCGYFRTTLELFFFFEVFLWCDKDLILFVVLFRHVFGMSKHESEFRVARKIRKNRFFNCLWCLIFVYFGDDFENSDEF